MANGLDRIKLPSELPKMITRWRVNRPTAVAVDRPIYGGMYLSVDAQDRPREHSGGVIEVPVAALLGETKNCGNVVAREGCQDTIEAIRAGIDGDTLWLINVISKSTQQDFRTTEELHAESLAPINLLADHSRLRSTASVGVSFYSSSRLPLLTAVAPTE